MSQVKDFDVAGYEEFRQRALDRTLSPNEKAGFPDTYRHGKSEAIFADIETKLPSLCKKGASFLDIGPGCGELAKYSIELSQRRGVFHTIVDSPEVLSLLPDRDHLTKVSGPFPRGCPAGSLAGFDAILVYSVVQYVFSEANIFEFLDAALSLLKPAGALLIGDVPNVSMRKRLLKSETGALFHQQNFPGKPMPEAGFNRPEPGLIDDAVVLSLLARSRAAGHNAFVVPQAANLPMANRREDILILRP